MILDAGSRLGDSWRARWDSLRLFTPARYDGLPGLRFPAAAGSFPSRDQMADYLEAYDFLSKLASAFVGGVGDDAEHVVRHLAAGLAARSGRVGAASRSMVGAPADAG